MTPNQWTSEHIRHCKQKLTQALSSPDIILNDFGKLIDTKATVVCEPQTISELQTLIRYAHENHLPVTIRGNGMSQSGQSLPISGGLLLNMQHFSQVKEASPGEIWIDANATWADLLNCSLKQSQIPYVVPHNCNLSIGGVLSAGGIGASSFKFGSVITHVKQLEILQVNGELTRADYHSPLAQACLGGQGHFGIITKACIALRVCPSAVRTFFLVYLDKQTWLDDLQKCQPKADYIEAFCSPAIQGAKLSGHGRTPFAQWFYALHISMEYEQAAPDFNTLDLAPWKLLHTQDESIHSYLHRHDSRFNAMKITGQWDLPHPWYECFIAQASLENLEGLLDSLPLHYASVLHLAPVANQSPSGFLMLPEEQQVFAFMILTPGVSKILLPGCLETIKKLDTVFLTQGGKRYLSGYLGESLDENYWKKHFGKRYSDWLHLKKQYDPHHVFCSRLHSY